MGGGPDDKPYAPHFKPQHPEPLKAHSLRLSTQSYTLNPQPQKMCESHIGLRVAFQTRGELPATGIIQAAG